MTDTADPAAPEPEGEGPGEGSTGSTAADVAAGRAAPGPAEDTEDEGPDKAS